ncbi:hypothetical protein CYLTODRAFT_452393 [Cylindrobasidium torrendii FP15055 ss-10]|uniref:Uncharacterized protein n=1 Tax=Cylindrobasidium torrendii FP15055 ss-10 TaxID=1314674 RepID=A0A0D7BHQ5_9AGAR|nr:hypothetical protein CYLTODRAFT_452393 [Cylindrobasidium torrendii FP15055 ss-10]
MASIAVAQLYQRSFAARPHSTLALTGGVLNALGDVVAQVYQNVDATRRRRSDKVYAYDVTRTMRFFCFGVAMSPLIGRWNTFLERRFPLRALNSNRVLLRPLLKRVACDQLIVAPLGLVAFLGSMSIMEGRNLAQTQEKFRDLYSTALIANWKVWPAAQLVNFRFMPLPYRVPFQSTCGVFWTLYLSVINSVEDARQDHEPRATANPPPPI